MQASQRTRWWALEQNSVGVVRPRGYRSVRPDETGSGTAFCQSARDPKELVSMPQLPPLDRARGCLLGLAIGDALGAPLEGLSAQQIRAHYNVVVDYVDGARAWKKKPYRWRMPGLYTDDTQQALAIADVLLEQSRVDPERLAKLYVD